MTPRLSMSSLDNESMGAFIDAVYAIAITILALEIPSQTDSSGELARVLGEYVVTFAILFSFWAQHRRLNSEHRTFTRSLLWLNGWVMLLVCLIPRATTMVFEYGGDVTLVDLQGTVLGSEAWTRSELVDVAYIAIVLGADFGLLALSRELRRIKAVGTLLVLLCLVLSILLPIPNRYVTLILPLALFFEKEILRLVLRAK
ncbi:MAG: TMEM175 family protein [Myxococcota bacterium]